MNQIHTLLKDLSSFVCQELCGKFLDYNECKECKFHQQINELVKYFNGRSE